MTVYILGNENNDVDDSEPTVTKLARQTGFEFLNGDVTPQPSPDDILIRYGYTKHPEFDALFTRVINPVSALNNSINKLLSFRLMQLSNIPIPKLYMGTSKQLDFLTPKNVIRKKDLPVLGRNIRHTRGTDIVMMNKMNDWVKYATSRDFYVQYIPTDIEYRIHVIDGECVRIQKKVLKPHHTKSFIHNVEHGYKLEDNFKHDLKLERKLADIAIKTAKALLLDFCAIDILVQKKWYTTKIYVLESNTAPHLDKYGRQLYGWYLVDWLGGIHGNHDMLELSLKSTFFSKKVIQQ
jgi:glutathione synthase/RimK-type ligase-like ATP-grasp enzyme